jgi:Zn-dependent M28 family amino/carboxypeptidase
MVRTQDGSGYGAANQIRRYGPSEAARRGAVAYLLRSLGTDSHRLPHTGALNYEDGAPRIPAAALAIPDADQLERLAALGPVRIRLLLTPTIQENAPSWNVVGEVKGPERPDEVVLIGGHLDSWDLGTGATDDGAGIAIAFGAARLIAGLPQRPGRTIRVVLFGAEEMNFSGAAYAQAHEGETGKIVVAGEADFGARNVYSVQLPGAAADSDFGHMLERIIAPLGANVDRRPALGGGDDIRELQKAGVPAVSLRQDGLDYFDTHHTADDTLDKIDPKQLDQAVAVWSAFTYLAAASDVDFRSLALTAK